MTATEPAAGGTVSREWLTGVIGAALPAGSGLVPLPRLNTDLTGRGEYTKVYFGVRCECTTAAVLSVEVGQSKTRGEVAAAVPAFVQKLIAQRDAFRRMSCEAHRRLRTQTAAAGAQKSRQPGGQPEMPHGDGP